MSLVLRANAWLKMDYGGGCLMNSMEMINCESMLENMTLYKILQQMGMEQLRDLAKVKTEKGECISEGREADHHHHSPQKVAERV